MGQIFMTIAFGTAFCNAKGFPVETTSSIQSGFVESEIDSRLWIAKAEACQPEIDESDAQIDHGDAYGVGEANRQHRAR